jgi:hypothetical protein
MPLSPGERVPKPLVGSPMLGECSGIGQAGGRSWSYMLGFGHKANDLTLSNNIC